MELNSAEEGKEEMEEMRVCFTDEKQRLQVMETVSKPQNENQWLNIKIKWEKEGAKIRKRITKRLEKKLIIAESEVRLN